MYPWGITISRRQKGDQEPSREREEEKGEKIAGELRNGRAF